MRWFRSKEKRWFEFYDMASGGYEKESFPYISIEARSKAEAIKLFRKVFGRDPLNITCDCCGEDYVISEVITPEGYILKDGQVVEI